MLNEQGDKIHRSVLGVKAQHVEVTIDSGFDAEGNITPYGYFCLQWQAMQKMHHMAFLWVLIRPKPKM
jgi:hypothetical protein